MSRSRPLRRRWKLTITAVVFAALGSLVAWGAASYLDLVRLQVDITDDCARVEAASRTQLDLVANLVHVPQKLDRPMRAGIERVRLARERAARYSFVPELLADPRRYGGFREAHTELVETLDGIWVETREISDPAARETLAALHERIERATAELERGLDGLEHSLDAYRDATETFPGSVVSLVSRFRVLRERPDADHDASTASSAASNHG